MSSMMEHPDITAAQRTGWPAGVPTENRDTFENRVEFAKDHPELLVKFLLAGDEDLIERLAEHYQTEYRNWLN